MAIFKETPLYFPWNQLFMHALYKHKSMSFIVVMKPCKESNRGRLTLQGVQDDFEPPQKKKNGQNSAVCLLNFSKCGFFCVFSETQLFPCPKQLSRTPCTIVIGTTYKMSSTYKIHLPNGKSWLTLQKRGNSNIISSVLHYFS